MGVGLPRYVFQPDNAVPIGTFIDNMEDRELMDILPVLLAVEKVADVRQARACVRVRVRSCDESAYTKGEPLYSVTLPQDHHFCLVSAQQGAGMSTVL